MEEVDPEDAMLARFGLHLAPDRAEEARRQLQEMTVRDHGVGDETLGMRVLCAGLFVLGDVRDSLLIWRAKMSSFDASCSIDVQLLVGAGVEVTKAHLAGLHEPAAEQALDYLRKSEAAGDFQGFSRRAMIADLEYYYNAL